MRKVNIQDTLDVKKGKKKQGQVNMFEIQAALLEFSILILMHLETHVKRTNGQPVISGLKALKTYCLHQLLTMDDGVSHKHCFS